MSQRSVLTLLCQAVAQWYYPKPISVRKTVDFTLARYVGSCSTLNESEKRAKELKNICSELFYFLPRFYEQKKFVTQYDTTLQAGVVQTLVLQSGTEKVTLAKTRSSRTFP